MPHLCVIPPGAAQRRQLSEAVSAFESKGFIIASRLEVKGDGKDISWQSIFAMGRSGGLFAQKQLFVAESADGLGELPEELGQYLQPLSDASSVIVCVFSSETKKIFSAISAADLKKIGFVAKEENIAPWKRKDWIIKIAKEQNVTIAADAAALLAESIEEQEELRGELNKLAECCRPNSVTLDDVKNLSFDEGGRALLKFLDGFSKRKVGDVISSLAHLKREPSPLPLLTALLNRLRPALYMTMFNEQRALASVGARDYAARMAKGALDIYGAETIQEFVLEMIRISAAEKTNYAEGWIGFESAVLLAMK